MSNQEIIKDFIDNSLTWIKSMEKMGVDKPCVCCGIIPNNIGHLRKAVKELFESKSK